MNDWLRSLAVLGISFLAVLTTTLGLAGWIVPGDRPPTTAVAGQSGAPVPAATAPPNVTGRPGIGGTLAVTGDRDGEFRLTREDLNQRYAIAGDDGRISLEGQPVEVAQLSYDGLEFFPDAGDCRITPLDLDTAIGIGRATFECTDLEDIRGNGTISLRGEIGLPVDMLAERSLPFSGGSLDVGDETWRFEELFLFTWQMPAIAGSPQHNLELIDRAGRLTGDEQPSAFNIDYDIETHGLTPVSVERGGEVEPIPAAACRLERTELGRQNPRTVVVELSIDCATVDVPGLGGVPIRGTVVVDELAWPE